MSLVPRHKEQIVTVRSMENQKNFVSGRRNGLPRGIEVQNNIVCLKSYAQFGMAEQGFTPIGLHTWGRMSGDGLNEARSRRFHIIG